MRNKLVVLALSCFMAIPFRGGEAFAGTCFGQSSATVISGISGTKDTQTASGGDLTFGTIVSGPSSGTVTIAPDTASRTASGGVQLVSSVFGPAVFSITGAAKSSYSVTLPNDGTISISSGTHAMAVNVFSMAPVSGVPTLNNEGAGAFRVGGRLEVPANQPPGDYRGTFEVTVVYQ